MLRKKKYVIKEPFYEEMSVIKQIATPCLKGENEQIIVEFKNVNHEEISKQCVDMSIINTNSIVSNGSFIIGNCDMNLTDPTDISNETSQGVEKILANSDFVTQVNNLNEE